MKQTAKHLFLPLTWTLFIQVLFLLPGSSLPSAPLFNFPNLDKIVHVTLLGIFVWLWCRYFYQRQASFNRQKAAFFIIFCIAAANGIIVEYIQYYFISNRSFDKGDIIADLIGSSLAYGLANITLLKQQHTDKKKPL